MQILKNIKDIKRSMIERDAAVKDVEDGASDMKRKAEDLTKKLDENEKEYQVYKGGNL
jgi:structural maintenance of chromosome 2